MAAPASRAPISLQSAFPVRPQVLPNRKLRWRASKKTASDLCVLVCTHEGGFLSRDDAAPTDLLVCQRPASTSALASAYVAAKGIRQAAATDGDVAWVADNSAHPIADGFVFAFLSIFVLASLPSCRRLSSRTWIPECPRLKSITVDCLVLVERVP